MGRFSGRNQQDSHEVLRLLLSYLKEEEIQVQFLQCVIPPCACVSTLGLYAQIVTNYSFQNFPNSFCP